MAKFLDTAAISSELMRLIKEAKEKIILVSYSIKVNPQIQERLKTKSQQGTLSEIVLVYGNTELKKSELEWIKGIQDLKLIEKSNLHAKCYLNEDKAIICSMNLYDYSQVNNIEMGILITKENDKDIYNEIIEEINNIKVNGLRKNISELLTPEKNIQSIQKDALPTTTTIKPTIIKYEDLAIDNKLNFQLLKQWRLSKSRQEKTAEQQILTDEEIIKIVSQKKLDKTNIYEIIPKKTAIRYSEEILGSLSNFNKYTIGRIVSVTYQPDYSKNYDKVKLKILKSNEEKWFDTTEELPTNNRIVAVKLNGSWFNHYFYLD